MKRIILFLISIFAPFTATTTAAILAASTPEETQQIELYSIEYKEIDRVDILRNFLSKYNSPLVDSAEAFVQAADFYNLDYRLLPAISCMESTCGKYLIPDSHNPFGWGVYGNQYIAFESYDHAIHEVGEGLYEGYFSKGADTLIEIAPIYTPPNSTNWYRGVSWFESQIEEIALDS